MGKNIKRLSLALIALGLSAPVLADTCSPFDVTVPNQQGGFTFGADALIMRATASNLGYSTEFGPTVTTGTTPSVTTTSGTLSDVDTTYQWGFDAMVGYRIPGTGNDVTLSWTHLGNFDDSDSNSNPITFFSTDDVADGSGFLNQASDVQFNYDAVDLDLGQRVNFGDYFNFRMFAGARWADVKEDIDNSYAATETTLIPSETAALYTTNDSEFKGVGPQIGFDGRYCLGYGFGIDANLTASLLVGDVDTTSSLTTAAFSGSTFDGSIGTSLDNNSRDRVVPALDASLGLDYTYAFANCDRSYLTVQAGYRVINYFDVTQDAVSDATATSTTSSAGYTLGNESANVAFDGGYMGVKVNL